MKTSTKILLNNRIYGPRGALELFRAIDFDRIQELGLQSKIAVYMQRMKEQGIAVYSQIFQGTVKVKKSSYLGCEHVTTDNIILPSPKYAKVNEAPHKLFGAEEFPAGLLFKGIDQMEFHISAKTSEEYEGLNACVAEVLPYVINRLGYNISNTEHHSTAWVYVGKENHVRPLCWIGLGCDLFAETDLFDGIKIFGRNDLEKLANLEMPK